MNILIIALFSNAICSTVSIQSYDLQEQLRQIGDLNRYVQGAGKVMSIETKLYDIRDITKGRHVPIKLGSRDTFAVCQDF